jgi:type VI secretion system protein ImpH
MEAAVRGARDPLAFFTALADAPFAHDFYQALRRVECLFPDTPRLGTATRIADEPVRLGQEPALDFAPATLSALRLQAQGAPPRLEVRFLGLLGPNGPLPLHLTDYARERLIHAGDATFARFLDVLNHRFLALFYRAWAQAQPTVQLDRPDQDRFAVYVGAVEGLAAPSLRRRDALPDEARLFFAGWLGRQVRNRDGLVALLAGYFRVPVQVEELVGHWMEVPADDRARLGSLALNAALGRGAVVGRAVWDRQHRIRIRLGPLGLAQYERFLPGAGGLERLVAAVLTYVGWELRWDVRLCLRRTEVPRARLGGYLRLGWTTWLGTRSRAEDAADLVLDPEIDREAPRRREEVA